METVELAVLEALADPRIAGGGRSLTTLELEAELARTYPAVPARELALEGLAETWGERVQLVVDETSMLDELRAEREVEWISGPVRYGDVLAGFGRHCREELEDAEVLEEGPSRLAVRCKREEASVELRAGLLFCERLAGGGPLLLLGDLEPAVVERFLADETLRSSVAVVDLARLQKVDGADSAVFRGFDRFLQESYGVELRAADSLSLAQPGSP